MAPSEGPLQIDASAAVPDPNPRVVAFKLSGAADDVELRLWSVSLGLLETVHSGVASAGWGQIVLPETTLAGLANGTYFYTLSARRGGIDSLPSKAGKLERLR
jgi:hypothetical protein